MTQNLRSSIKGALNSSIKGGFHDLVFTGSTLDLDFAGAKSLKNQVGKKDVVSFTRASSATYVDGNGLIKTSPVNLMVYSEKLDQWNVFHSGVVTSNAIAAPDGTFTADLIDVSAGGIAQVTKSFTVKPSTTYTVSFWAKSITATDVLRLYRPSSNGGSDDINITNEWQRYTSTYTTAASSPYGNVLFIYLPGTTNQYYVWGVQVEEGSTATDYIPTTSTISGAPRFDYDPATGESLGLLIEEARTNRVLYSSPANSWWNKPNLNHTSASVDNPFNYSAVRRHTATTNSGPHYFYRNDINFLNANTDYTFSAFVAPEGTGVDAGKIQLRIFLIGADAGFINFDLNTGQSNAQAGTSGTSAGGSSWSISDYGMQSYAYGWYRVWMTFRSTMVCSVGIVSINSLNAPDFQVYTSAGNGGYYVTGIQVEQGTFRTSPINTDGATVTRAADVAEITGNKFAKTNLVPYSQRFDQKVANNEAFVQPNVIAAPDGTVTAERFSRGGTGYSNYQNVLITTKAAASITYNYSMYFKKDTARYVSMRIQGVYPSRADAVFDLDTGTVASAVPLGNYVSANSNITHVGGGWYRCVITAITSADTALQANYSCSAEAVSIDQPSSVANSAYVWGAQVEEGTLTDYTPSVESFVSRASSATYVDDTTGLIKTTPVNVLVQSETVDQWSIGTGAIVTANATTAPDGTLTADRVQLPAGENVFTSSVTLKPNTTYTSSIYVKDNGTDRYIQELDDKAFGGLRYRTTFTFSTKTLVTSGSGAANMATPAYEEVGDGWFRIIQTITVQSTATNLIFMNRFSVQDNFLWGAQFEEGTTASPYIKTTSTISGAARYENGELILEGSRTNIIDNNTTHYNSIWANSVPAGAYNNAGIAPDGTNTAFATTDYGGARGQKNYSMTADTNDYTFSIFIKSTGGQGVYKTYGTGFYTGDSDTGGNTAYDFATDTVGHGYSRKLYANGWVRIWKTYTNTNLNLFLTSNGSGTSLDMLFWGAQLEQGSYPSSLIITPAGANVTRAADVSTSALGVDSFYNQTEGTLFAQTRINRVCDTGGTGIVWADDQTVANYIGLYYRGNGQTGSSIRRNNVDSLNTNPYGVVPANTPIQQAVAYKAGDSVGAGGGNLTATNLSSNIPTTNRLLIGDFVGVGAPLDGHIKRITYFPTRLPNANLQNITS